MTANKAMMEEAKRLLDRGELPDKVSQDMLWSGLIAIFGQVSEINGTSKENKIKIRWLFRILGAAWTVLLIAIANFIGLIF